MLYVNLRGGLGNQLFQYASAFALSKKLNEQLCLDLSGITNESHNVYALDKFNISASTINKCNILQKKISKIFNSISYRIGKKFGYEKSYTFDKITNKVLNVFGIYNVDNGYINFKKSITKNKYLNGYLQSSDYFKEYEKEIKKELSLKKIVNTKLKTEIKNNNSICVHIRRGDFVSVGAIVCTEEYYVSAVEFLKSKMKDAEFYIFSNDINWVKENIKFPFKVNFVTDRNSSYDELYLMSLCNNFVISNSTFSYWGQYLSKSKNKIVIAPNKWFKDGQKEDIYEDDWIIMDEKGNIINNR